MIPLEITDETINAEEFIKLVSQEKYDAILAIENATKQCEDNVLVR